MKTKLLIFALAVCMIATPARADLFYFSVHSLDMTYDGTTFGSALNAGAGTIALTRVVPPAGSIGIVGGGVGDFTISMAITNVLAGSADGAGTWTLTDTIGDTITGNLSGTWSNPSQTPLFVGTLDSVYWNNESTDNDFDGDSGSVSMGFAAPQPWNGSVVHLTASSADWFGSGAWGGTVTGGSVDANVVPVPAAVLLGMLGLSVAGVKLRKYA